MTAGEVGPDGRSTRNGQFVKGEYKGGPGRRLGSVNLRRLVREKAAEAGTDAETIVWSVFAALIARARGGDVRAAVAVLEYLCDREAIELLVTHEGSVSTGPAAVPDSSTLAHYLAELAGVPDSVRRALADRAGRADAAELGSLLG
ncbi:MAG TPA: hypothetical protein VNM34_14925 [Verrucomicrobiae bacterium]|nr:hypothetical protein [Verrucomicrobiae bacterium]